MFENKVLQKICDLSCKGYDVVFSTKKVNWSGKPETTFYCIRLIYKISKPYGRIPVANSLLINREEFQLHKDPDQLVIKSLEKLEAQIDEEIYEE